jgi:asparagine synthase (glutamine-hydrolysing)
VCGIVGFTGPPQPLLLQSLTDSLRHRGPDGEGSASVPSPGPGIVHLGHRRLVVLDREGGRQPMALPDGRWVITFNGEIYNHAELREELAREGARFRTRSDTEVLLQALARWGEDALPRLDGMFAFGAFEAARRRLLLAVDRFGQKPLVWSVLRDGGMVFASELTALRRHTAVAEEWDLSALCRMLALEAVPAPQTILRHVFRLEPGSALWADLDRDGVVTARRVFRWWRPPFGARAQSPPALDEFVAALRQSVRRHLVADVPVGVLLSGGLDSTAVAALSVEDRPLLSLSMGFGDPRYDESRAAATTARVLGTDHHEFRFEPAQAAGVLDEVMSHLDEPLADAGCLPAWVLYRHARRMATVVVGGDGGDELLEGYPTFQALQIGRRLKPLAWSPLVRMAERVARLWPVGEQYYPLGYQARRLLAGVEADPWHALHLFTGGCHPALLQRLLRPETLAAAGFRGRARDLAAWLYDPAFPAELGSESHRLHPRDVAVWLHLRSFLAGEVLRKVDRMSMAHGLEVRAPMLGSPFAELCLGAPPAVRRRGRHGKLPLRRWLAGSPLAHVAAGPKRGFAIPVAGWLRMHLRPAGDAAFLDAGSPLLEWCRPGPLADLWRGHLAGGEDARKELWALLSLGLWMTNQTRRAGSRQADHVAAHVH